MSEARGDLLGFIFLQASASLYCFLFFSIPFDFLITSRVLSFKYFFRIDYFIFSKLDLNSTRVQQKSRKKKIKKGKRKKKRTKKITQDR